MTIRSCLFLALAGCGSDPDADGDGFGASEDCDDHSIATNPDAAERCDFADNDCDGEIDEGVQLSLWQDDDDDGWGGTTQIESCAGAGNVASVSGDCDDADSSIHPKAPELCDGKDHDCDGKEQYEQTWYADTDGDGYGDDATAIKGCDAPSGFVVAGGDCDDGDPAVNPSAAERCDNDVDDDCDNVIATQDDTDGDGYSAGACKGGGDCDDDNPGIHPGADETCEDGIDSDCSGTDLTCAFSGDYDLADAISYTSTEKMLDGGRLVEAGDVTGDGVDDVLVATLAGDGGQGGGYVVPGPVSGVHTLEDAAYRISSVEATGGASRSISIGDINADGIGDVGFGAPYAQLNGQYVTFGPITADASLAGADLSLTVDEYLPYCGHGSDLADVNGDGYEDAIIGEFADSLGGSNSGTVYVQWGPLAGGDIDLLSEADVTIAGIHENGVIGRMIRAGHDIDGDGVGDIAVNAIWDSTVAPYAGGVYVVYGPADITSFADADGWMPGPGANAYAGTAFTVGDFDGDGLADVAADALSPTVVYVVPGPVSGENPMGDADWILTHDVSYYGSGLGTGDVDGDGVDELAIGSPYDSTKGMNAGVTYLVTDLVTGTADVDDVAVARFFGVANDIAGQGLTIDDVDNDGAGDVIIGGPGMGAGGGLYVASNAP